MANVVYPVYKQNLLAGTAGYDLDNDTTTDGPYCALLSAGYTYNAADDFYNDVTPGSNVVGTSQRITTPTVANGTFDGSDLTYTAVTGSQVTQLVVYRQNAGGNTTWPLVLKLDTGVTGLPVTPNGGNITITWNASGIFTICDRNMKRDIVKCGQIGPLGVYEYRYAWAVERYRGFMAHEVEAFAPHAVKEIDGYRRVNYAAALAALRY